MKVVLFFCFYLSLSTISKAQTVSGTDIPEFGETFGVDVNRTEYSVSAYLIKSSIPGNILWPNDDVELTIQLKNNTDKELFISGKVEVISYGTRGRPSDIWTPQMFKIRQEERISFNVQILSKSFQNITIKPTIPKIFGAYGVVIDLGEHGRQFITSCARTFSSPKQRIQYPAFCLDDISNEVLERLGVHAIRHELSYHPTTDPDFEEWYQTERERLIAYQKSDIAVLVKMGAPDAYGKMHPLGIPRPWLDDKGVMQNTKTDMAWMPRYDEDFKKLVYKLAIEFGWPKGPINAFALWNEPWEGISISGWGADIPRYREIYTKMAEAIEEARRDAGVDVLVGGCSSTSNALDKLFADGTDEFLDRFDFCSIHYQGMSSSSTIKKWVDRKSNRGRVKIWDTESWVANVDDRVAAVVATNRSAGYDRAMGIFRGNICQVEPQNYFDKEGKEKTIDIIHAWSVAPAIGAAQHFLGERKFKELLFKNGLPWISVFEGLNGDQEDGTLVVVGDIGEEFGAGNILFRTARGLEEQKHEQQLKQEVALLNPAKDQSKIDSLNQLIDKDETLINASLTISDSNGLFRLYDFYGNDVPSINGTITVPLDGRGFFLRSDGSQNSFQKLVETVGQGIIKGIEPLETIAYDFTSQIASKPELTLKLTNILNRPIKGVLKVDVKNIEFETPSPQLYFRAHETKFVKFKISSGKPATDNLYPLELVFDGGDDGKAIHNETLHVNVIAKRNIKVDGKLDDWTNVLPQIIRGDETSTTSLTEAAWFPFKNFSTTEKGGIASGYLAYDEDYFYFAAKVSDESVDEGMRRFETLDTDEFFYPEKSHIPYNGFQFSGAMKHDGISFSTRWTGKLKPDHSENYTFYLPSKGQARLWIDGKLLIDGWARGFETEVEQLNEATLFLKKNIQYDVKIEFAKDVGSASIHLLWKSKHYAKGLVPSSVLFSEQNLTKQGNGLSSEWFNGANFNVYRTKRIDGAIDFNWNDTDVPDSAFLESKLIELKWPSDVRQYSYRKDTETPFGNFSDHDNVQIAFNVLDEDEKELYPFPPGTMKGYTNYQCTDYEYALNPVAEQYGGGTELWRSKVPGMPHKHFFPRQTLSLLDGPVKAGKLKIIREGNTRIVEAAIPWSEITAVKKRLDNKQKIKFSFRINDNTPHGCMELAYKRSVSKINGAFKVDWKEHWANEVEFSFENSEPIK
jgi:hypothetical protein